MKAFILDRYKKKEALRFGDMPEPQLRDGDVLVEIHAAGLNQLDAKIRDGCLERTPLVILNDQISDPPPADDHLKFHNAGAGLVAGREALNGGGLGRPPSVCGTPGGGRPPWNSTMRAGRPRF